MMKRVHNFTKNDPPPQFSFCWRTVSNPPQLIDATACDVIARVVFGREMGDLTRSLQPPITIENAPKCTISRIQSKNLSKSSPLNTGFQPYSLPPESNWLVPFANTGFYYLCLLNSTDKNCASSGNGLQELSLHDRS